MLKPLRSYLHLSSTPTINILQHKTILLLTLSYISYYSVDTHKQIGFVSNPLRLFYFIQFLEYNLF